MRIALSHHCDRDRDHPGRSRAARQEAKRLAPRWHLYPEFADCGTRSWVFPGSFGIQVHEPTRDVVCRDHAVRLETRPFDMLMMLLRRPDRLSPRALFREVLWGDRPTADAALTKCAGKVRTALGGDDTGLLLVSYGIGYRLAVPPERLPTPPDRP